jgi:1,4-dihydroxy-2-naphthoate octaprenyltransferase
MTSLKIWFQGSRPKTLGAAISPVIVAWAIVYFENSFNLYIALLALIVSITIQIGVNFANDYSDGIKGTDSDRVGPVRLVGQKLASAKSVKRAAYLFFFIAAFAGLLITIETKQWWFLILGALAIISAWTYTGGPKPYGYLGLGEIFVFVFFGLVATLGTIYAQTLYFKTYFLIYAVVMGFFATAILVANNLRDREKDKENNKITLAVKLGDSKTRVFFISLLVLAYLLPLIEILFNLLDNSPLSFIPFYLASFPFAYDAIRKVRNKAIGKDLIPVLVVTGQTQLFYSLLICLSFYLETI